MSIFKTSKSKCEFNLRKSNFNKAVYSVSENKMPIHFSLCYDRKKLYYPSIESQDKDIQYEWQNIVLGAISELTEGRFTIYESMADFLVKSIDHQAASKGILAKSFNVRYDAKLQRQHGVSSSTVTSFDIYLSDVIDVDGLIKSWMDTEEYIRKSDIALKEALKRNSRKEVIRNV